MQYRAYKGGRLLYTDTMKLKILLRMCRFHRVCSSLPASYALYCVLFLLIVLLCYTCQFSPIFFTRLLFPPLFLAVFILVQLYWLYYTDEGHCIVPVLH